MSRPLLQVKKPDGTLHTIYTPSDKQWEFHGCSQPNVVYIGSRGTGKSLALRMEGHARAMAFPKFKYAILALTFDDLNKIHLQQLEEEMKLLGGYFHVTNKTAHYPNGSIGYYSHIGERKDNLGNLLGAEVYWLGVDELCSVDWELFRKVVVSVRVPEALSKQGVVPMVRGTTNPAGVSVDKVYQYFIDKNPENDPLYKPEQWHAVRTHIGDNPHITQEQYDSMFAGLPPHLLKAWRDGERAAEDQLFFLKPEHFTKDYPDLANARIYRALDFGTYDPTVCLWFAVYPNGRVLVFRERTFKNELITDITKAIKAESQNMRVVETFCDPSMFKYQATTSFNSVGDQFEQQGIALTPSVNDRAIFVTAISQYLYTTLPDGLPRMQIYVPGCPQLVKTLPLMRADTKHPERMADGNDHWAVSLAYFCQSYVAIPHEPKHSSVPTPGTRDVSEILQRIRFGDRRVMGRESVKRR